MPTADRPFTLIGAGLVGGLLATLLARRGQRVQVFERLPDLRAHGLTGGRSINLALSERGLRALRAAGLEAEARAHALPMRGRLLHARDGSLTLQPYGKDDSQSIHSISRSWLNGLLLEAAEASGRVELHFEHRLEAIALDGLARLRGPRGAVELPVERLIAADGAGSAVRHAMAQQTGFQQSEDWLSHGYKELSLPAREGRHQLAVDALHIWPRGSHMLIALPNADGSFTCTLFLALVSDPNEPLAPAFDTLAGAGAVASFFAAHYADAQALIPDLTAQFAANPVGRMGTVKCAPWNAGDRALLIGDAAHALVPFYGQGMNCGFEDCLSLDRLLAADGWEATCRSFGSRRKSDTDAIADMAVENFVEMRDKTGDPRFLLEKGVERQLLRAFPAEFLSRYTLVSFSQTPYRLAYQIGEIASAIVAELSQGLAAPEAVDLAQAQRLIASRLTPFLQEHRHELGPRG